MFDKLKTKMLERHIRDLLERYYWQFGLTLEEAKRLPMLELMEKVNQFLANNKNEVGYYAAVVGHLDEKVELLTINNEEMKHRMNDLKGENRGLHGELAALREENYQLRLENTLYKQQGFVYTKEQENELTAKINQQTQGVQQTKTAEASLAR